MILPGDSPSKGVFGGYDLTRSFLEMCMVPHSARLCSVAFGMSLILLGGCSSPLLDSPSKVRQSVVTLPPLYSLSQSEDGTSSSWSALFWLVGRDVESERENTRVLPFFWHANDPPYRSATLVLPFYYGETTASYQSRFYSLLYGYKESETWRNDYFALPFFHHRRSKVNDDRSITVFPYIEWARTGAQQSFGLSLLGLATAITVQWGLPAEGETVGALGRESSRKMEVGNVLGLVSAFGYNDVGDTRDIRLMSVFSSETLSVFRSWRGRGDNPFVREWAFPLYMNIQDEGGGWSYVGPLWGEISDRDEGWETDWWLAGLLARTRAPEGDTWRVFGLPVSSP